MILGFIVSRLRNLRKGKASPRINGQAGIDVSQLSLEEKEKVMDMLKHKMDKELDTPPKIAIIGKTGVGKSSTINSLFNTNLKISHTESCTMKATPIKITNGKGEIIIYDMPGLGEDIDKDEEHKQEYRRVLPECDVVLWILNVSDREMTSPQLYIKDILTYLDGRLVICANQADKVYPEDWNSAFNYPSRKQEEILEQRITDIKKKLFKVAPDLSEEMIVYYSALKRFRLNELFGAMLAACPDDRAWLLNERGDLKDFKELIDKEILKKIRRCRMKMTTISFLAASRMN